MAVVLVFEDVLRLTCGHALKGERSLEEKQTSYEIKN